MAAKNKFKGRGHNSISREDADVQDLLGLHFQACRRAEEVEEQIQELQAAGKFPEARVLRMHSLGIQQGLRAIEAEVQSVMRPARQLRPTPTAAGDPANTEPAEPTAQSSFAPRRGSLRTDFEAAVDPRVTLEITR